MRMKRIFILTVGFIVCMKLMAQSPVSFYPQENAQGINIDTHLVIEFTRRLKPATRALSQLRIRLPARWLIEST